MELCSGRMSLEGGIPLRVGNLCMLSVVSFLTSKSDKASNCLEAVCQESIMDATDDRFVAAKP